MKHYTNDYRIPFGCLPQPTYEDVELRGRMRRASRQR